MKVFLLSDAVYYQFINAGQFNIEEQFKTFVKSGGTILADDVSLSLRHPISTKDIQISTMLDCVKMVEWADKVMTF